MNPHIKQYAREVCNVLGLTMIVLVTKTQLEGTSPQVDNRGVVVCCSAENLEAVRVRAKQSERPGFESQCGAIVCSRSERGGEGGEGRSRSERCVRGFKKKIVTSPRSLTPYIRSRGPGLHACSV